VVNYRDRLIELAWSKATSGEITKEQKDEILQCLKNRGERKEKVDWSNRVGRLVLFCYYWGTCLVCSLVSILLGMRPLNIADLGWR
jgi:hypothetical protein